MKFKKIIFFSYLLFIAHSIIPSLPKVTESFQSNPIIQQWHKENLMYSVDVTDSDLLETFEFLKKDLHAPADVSLRIIKQGVPDLIKRFGRSYGGFYSYYSKIVYITEDSLINKKFGVSTLVHELEHARQFEKCSGSYHGHDRYTLEHEADKAAAEYVKCPSCLEEVSYYTTDAPSNKFGYFVRNDYMPYITKAKQNNCLCVAHAFSDIFKNFKYTHYLPNKINFLKRSILPYRYLFPAIVIRKLYSL